MMNVGPFPFFLLLALYFVPLVLLVVWMVRMLKNSNENVRLNREILQILNKEAEYYHDKSSSS